ncbi:hypothetical protein ACVGXC_00015, partial [Enterobacter hormaechei]
MSTSTIEALARAEATIALQPENHQNYDGKATQKKKNRYQPKKHTKTDEKQSKKNNKYKKKKKQNKTNNKK